VEIYVGDQNVGHIFSRKISENVLHIDDIGVHPDYRGNNLSTVLYGKALEAAGPQITEVRGTPVGTNMRGITEPAASARVASLAHYGFNEHFMVDNVLVSRRPPLANIK
jgi:hypothetical protein